MKKYISIDIGGTAIKYGIVSEDAEVLLKKEMKTEAQKGGPAILDKVIGIVEALKEEATQVCVFLQPVWLTLRKGKSSIRHR